MFFLKTSLFIYCILLAVAQKGFMLQETDNNCPHDKPYRCPGGMCYGLFQYCSPEGPEYCVASQDTKKLCVEVARGKNVSNQIRHESCHLLAACVTKYGRDLFNKPEQDESSWKIVAITLVIVLVAVFIVWIVWWWRRRRCLKKSPITRTGEKGSQDCEAPSPPVPMENISKIIKERDQPQGLSSEENANYNEHQHLLGEEQGDGSRNSTSPSDEPPLCTSIRNDATDHQSAKPVQNCSGCIFSGSTSSSSRSSDTQIHPAEEESIRQRAVHISETFPVSNDKGYDVMVTNMTPHATNAGNV